MRYKKSFPPKYDTDENVMQFLLPFEILFPNYQGRIFQIYIYGHEHLLFIVFFFTFNTARKNSCNLHIEFCPL